LILKLFNNKVRIWMWMKVFLSVCLPLTTRPPPSSPLPHSLTLFSISPFQPNCWANNNQKKITVQFNHHSLQSEACEREASATMFTVDVRALTFLITLHLQGLPATHGSRRHVSVVSNELFRFIEDFLVKFRNKRNPHTNLSPFLTRQSHEKFTLLRVAAV
jgi:hypothetical protein